MRLSCERASERGLALFETLLAAAAIAALSAGLYQMWHNQQHFRHYAAAGREIGSLLDRIEVRLSASTLWRDIPVSTRRTLGYEDLAASGLIAAHDMPVIGRGYRYTAIIERRSADSFTLHLLLHGGEVLAAHRSRAMLNTVRQLEWFSGHQTQLDGAPLLAADILPADTRYALRADGHLAPRTSGGINLGALPASLPRAWRLSQNEDWWLHPHYMPVTYDIARKLDEGWVLDPLAEPAEVMVDAPVCGGDEEPLVLTAPAGAFDGITQSGAAVSRRAAGETRLAAYYADAAGQSREIRITLLEERSAVPVEIVRAGGVPLLPSALSEADGSSYWRGLILDGLLAPNHNEPLALPAPFRASAHTPALVTSNRAFTFAYGEAAPRLIANGDDTLLIARSLLAGAERPVWRSGGQSGRAHSGQDWQPLDSVPQLAIDLTLPRARGEQILTNFRRAAALLPSFTFTPEGERIFYDYIRGDANRVFQSLYDSLRPHAVENIADTEAEDFPPANVKAYILPGAIAHPAAGERITLPAPAAEIPQAINLNEMIMDCDGRGVCAPLAGSGIHSIARNDAETDTSHRPDGALHFGKVRIAFPREALDVFSFCL